VGLVESLAMELAPDHVTVNCVCPGACPTTGMGQMLIRFKTQLTGKPEQEVLDSITSTFPLGRYVTEDDVVSALMYFITDEASLITGVSLDIDGGIHLGYVPGV
jgi:NAD(P)-dependent dehydrogenase (short-subunit alcohol dehydrogenase family)